MDQTALEQIKRKIDQLEQIKSEQQIVQRTSLKDSMNEEMKKIQGLNPAKVKQALQLLSKQLGVSVTEIEAMMEKMAISK